MSSDSICTKASFITYTGLRICQNCSRIIEVEAAEGAGIDGEEEVDLF
jgi:hypothetical protein